MDKKDFGKRIKEIRNKASLTQANISEDLGVSVKYWSNIETGRESMSIELMLSMLKHLDMPAKIITESSYTAPNLNSETMQELKKLDKKQLLAVFEFLKQINENE